MYVLVTGRNWIQLPAVIYATMISTHHPGIIVFGVEFFGEAGVPDPEPGEVPPVQPAVRAGAAASC